jgi:hypothetical protein
MANQTDGATKEVPRVGTPVVTSLEIFAHGGEQQAITTMTLADQGRQRSTTLGLSECLAQVIVASDEQLLAQGYQRFGEEDLAIARSGLAAGAEQLPPA